MKWHKYAIWGLLILLFVSASAGVTQDSVCTRIVDTALQATDQLCENTRINQACYGHARLDADIYPEYDLSTFDAAGEKIDVAALQSLRLSAMNVFDGLWGVALMQVEARLPLAVPPERVTFLMFGDVQVRNGIEAAAPAPVVLKRSTRM